MSVALGDQIKAIQKDFVKTYDTFQHVKVDDGYCLLSLCYFIFSLFYVICDFYLFIWYFVLN